MLVFTIIPPKSIFGKARYELLEDIAIGGTIIPRGFVTDGATVPRILWSLFPPISSYFRATLLHDYLLSIGTNRYKADKKFKQVALQNGVTTWVVNIMYVSVVVYGFCVKPNDYLRRSSK